MSSSLSLRGACTCVQVRAYVKAFARRYAGETARIGRRLVAALTTSPEALEALAAEGESAPGGAAPVAAGLAEAVREALHTDLHLGPLQEQQPQQ